MFLYLHQYRAHHLRQGKARSHLCGAWSGLRRRQIRLRGPTFEVEDQRRDHGGKRVICFALLNERLVVVGYTPRGADRHVFSMRKANDREQARIGPILGL
ncbi:MAG: BrnT family toxin [Pseudomonadota bacterium]